MSKIQRNSASHQVTLDTATLANCTLIDLRGYAGGSIINTSTIASTGYTFYGTWETKDGDPGDEFVEILTKAGASTALSGLSASKAAPFPDEVFGFPFIKIISQADDTEKTWINLKS